MATTYDGPDRRTDAGKLASAAEVLRRWWLLAIIIAALLSFAAGVAVGHGAMAARLDSMEARVGKLESTAERIVRVEGMLDVLYTRETGKRYPEAPAEVTP
jgi:hypothetical protein